jgi:hypothetical protein
LKISPNPNRKLDVVGLPVFTFTITMMFVVALLFTFFVLRAKKQPNPLAAKPANYITHLGYDGHTQLSVGCEVL